jgi:DNA-binding MarR family transcriptional regulator
VFLFWTCGLHHTSRALIFFNLNKFRVVAFERQTSKVRRVGENNQRPEEEITFNFSSPNLPMRTPGSRGNHPQDKLIHILPRYNKVYNEFISNMNQAISKFTSLNVNQIILLGIVSQRMDNGEPISGGEAAEIMGVSNAAVSKMMDALEYKELCVRVRVPGRRSKSVLMTAKGERVLAQTANLIDSVHDAFHDNRLKEELVSLAEYIIEEYREETTKEGEQS